MLIQPALAGEALLADIRQANARDGGFRLWWLGQSGFLLQWEGRHLLFDPYLSDSLTRKYAATDKPHIRMTELAVTPERLDFIDVVTSSHNHTDHLDAETLGSLLAVNPNIVFVIAEANRAFVAGRLHIPPAQPLGLDDGGSCSARGFRIAAVPSAHEEVDRDEAGRCQYLGYVVQFGGWSVYQSGDTVRYQGMAEKLRPFGVDVALLPINGRAPERRVPGNLSGVEAAVLAHDMGAKLVIPCHYDMFAFNTAPPDEFVSACGRLGQPYRLVRCGERWTSEVGVAT
jgi:L-ascorbate metabolism protein UlaG (beta-lactamase superfamily)